MDLDSFSTGSTSSHYKDQKVPTMAKKVLQTSGLKNGFHNAHLYMHPYILALINDGLI
jgi:hypothetical protein